MKWADVAARGQGFWGPDRRWPTGCAGHSRLSFNRQTADRIPVLDLKNLIQFEVSASSRFCLSTCSCGGNEQMERTHDCCWVLRWIGTLGRCRWWRSELSRGKINTGRALQPWQIYADQCHHGRRPSAYGNTSSYFRDHDCPVSVGTGLPLGRLTR